MLIIEMVFEKFLVVGLIVRSCDVLLSRVKTGAIPTGVFLLSNIDMCNYLYRYQPINEKSLSALSRSIVYGATPDLFNDPYDGKFVYTVEQILTFLKKEKLYEEFQKQFDELDLDEVEKVRLFSSLFSGEMRVLCQVACFSETINKEIMWTHYASGGQGFAIQYDMDLLKDAFKEKNLDNHFGLRKVHYVESKRPFDIYICRKLSCLLSGNISSCEDDYWVKDYAELLVEKSSDWSYEREWRLIAPNKDRRSWSGDMLKLKPDGIVLGENISRINRYLLCCIARQQGLSVSEAKTVLRNGRYELKISPLSDEQISDYIQRFGGKISDLYMDAIV